LECPAHHEPHTISAPNEQTRSLTCQLLDDFDPGHVGKSERLRAAISPKRLSKNMRMSFTASAQQYHPYQEKCNANVAKLIR